ncbi:MAG: hypothetical protein ACIWVG_04600, partial [Gloeotrichia echinulata HAB0833]
IKVIINQSLKQRILVKAYYAKFVQCVSPIKQDLQECFLCISAIFNRHVRVKFYFYVRYQAYVFSHD